MNILDDIVRHKRDEIASRKRKTPAGELREREHFQRRPLSLRGALTTHPVFGVIAEVKRASPSAGLLRKALDPASVARAFERHGAAGISVLTDERFFSGTLDDLLAARSAVRLPLLRKDFILDEYQIYEAKASGADAVLLIASLLERNQLADLALAAASCGMESLVELYESKEIDILDFDSMNLIGVNNRDLKTFQVDLSRTLKIAPALPPDVTIVSESGITSGDDLRRLTSAGIRAALIGGHFMRSNDPGQALGALLAEVGNGHAR
jgi:indole-3-glycerol phosphate synthase